MMTNGRRLACVFIFVWTGFAALFGQQESSSNQGPLSKKEEDIFSESAFDKNVTEGKAEAQANKLTYLFGGSFVYNNDVSTTFDLASYRSGGNFNGKLFVKLDAPDYGFLYLSYLYSNTIYEASNDPSYPMVDTDPFSMDFNLSEFYLGFDIFKAVFFRIGNQLNAWGASYFWTPVDFFNIQRINTLEAVDLRVGKPSLKMHIPFRSSNLFLILDLSETLAQGVVHDLAKTVNVMGRYDITALGFELGIMGFWGPRDSWLIHRYGADLSGRLLGFDLYTEHSVNLDSRTSEAEYSFSTGFERTLGELSLWTIQGEFYYNSQGYQGEEAAALIPLGRFTPFYIGRYYIYGKIGRKDLFTSGLNGSLSSVVNLSDLSYQIRLSFDFDLANLIPFTFFLSYNGGDLGNEFTPYESRIVTFGARVAIEF